MEETYNRIAVWFPDKAPPEVFSFSDKKPITLDDVVEYMEQNYNVDWDKDSVTLVDTIKSVFLHIERRNQ